MKGSRGSKGDLWSKTSANMAPKFARNTGDDVMNLVNQKIGRMSESQFEEAKRLERDVLDALFMAMKSGDARSESQRSWFESTGDWLRCYWPVYTAEMHAALSESYVTDKRFSDYYSKAGGGAGRISQGRYS